jgi:deoxyribodipyrimidine photo-lyase
LNVIDKLKADPRVSVRQDGELDCEGRSVVYWMQRAQRGADNPALDVAIDAANELGVPAVAFLGLHPRYPNANLRHYSFLLQGLPETIRRIEHRGVSFVFRPYPDHDLISFCTEAKPCLVIGDENPLRAPESWRRSAAKKLNVPFWTVDADVVVPARLFPKEEYAARTLRPKIKPLIEVFLQPSTNPQARVRLPASRRFTGVEVNDRLLETLPLDPSAAPVTGFKGGTQEAIKRLRSFLRERLRNYDEQRNRPDVAGTSELSAYLHFGHISPITIACAVRDESAPEAAKASYLEELIVRRELAINYVARNPDYDSLAGCPEWARATLAAHAADPRPYIYDVAQLEAAQTHDPLWNAAQTEMLRTGRMHGYLRMYWAKKILEWTRSPEEAFDISVQLNDRYLLDGRDPNGYAGIAWAIGGKHDRPWPPNRAIFGLVRYMSADGMARKFDVRAYVERVSGGMP